MSIRKMLITCLLAGMSMFTFAGCGDDAENTGKVVLRVANCEEYIDEGECERT